MSIVELRQYTTRPGRRSDLVAVFDAELVETQEECGMTVVGQFRDLDRPDRFVWLRGFPDLPARHRALTAFYDGPVWARHGPAANDTMLEFDDVLLLRTVVPFDLPATRGTHTEGPALYIVVERGHDGRPGPGDLAFLVSEPAPNSYTRLPVREGEDVTVRVRRDVPANLDALQVIRAAPTPRSLLR